jgi:hypothetical protein
LEELPLLLLACIKRLVVMAYSRVCLYKTKRKAPEVYSVANNWVQQKIALARFAADRYQFAFYEKSKAVRFVFAS